MKTIYPALSAMLLMLVIPICPTQAQSGATDEGIDVVEVVTATATVEKIYLEKRKVTLLSDDDKKKTYKVDSRVQNLAQVKVGDHRRCRLQKKLPSWLASPMKPQAQRPLNRSLLRPTVRNPAS
jgi:hypothetical protein